MALIGMLLGAAIGLGLVQLLRGGRPLPRIRQQASVGVWVGIAAGVGLWLLTGFPVLGLAGGFLASQIVRGFAEAKAERLVLARRADLARIAARLRDACLAGHGLPAALSIAAASAGPETGEEMAALARAVREVGVGRAFGAYAAGVSDPLFSVFARVVGEADRQGSDALSSLLTRLATQTAREVAAARETAARQTGQRATAPIVASLAVGLVLVIRFNSPSYAAAYRDFFGQVMMALAFVPIGLAYWAMVRTGRGNRALSWGTP